MEKDVYALELFIARFLRYGVLVAGVLMLAGWLTQLSFSQDTFAHFQVYHDVRIYEALQEAWAGERWGLLTSYLGMFVLISLPLLRVLMTFAVFVKKRDYALAAVSGLVIFGLALSIALGFEI